MSTNDSTERFHRHCPNCGDRDICETLVFHRASLRHDGRRYEFDVPELRLPVCQKCGERIFTEDADSQIRDALRANLGLLTSTQIRDAIDQLRLTQKEVAKRTGVAEATLSRWLVDSQIQCRAMDNLLRVFFAFPEVRIALAADRQASNSGNGGVAVNP